MSHRLMSYRIATAPLVALALSLFLTAPALSQDGPARRPDAFWISAGLGAGSEDYAGHAGVSYQHGPHLFSLRLAGTAGLFDDGFGDVALLYGRATRAAGAKYRLGAAAGISGADGCVTPGEGSVFANCADRTTVVGFPLEVQAAWLPSEFLGVGLYGFADFNATRSFGGVTLAVQLGRVR